MGLWFELTDGREWLSEAEVDAVCDALWSSHEKGAVSIVGRIAHEQRRPRVLQGGVKLSESERHVFRRAVNDARHVAKGR
jgi:hypothetical protein